MLYPNIERTQDLPVQQQHRKSTDLTWTVLSSIFAIVLFFIAFITSSRVDIKQQLFRQGSSQQPNSLLTQNDTYGFLFTFRLACIIAVSLGLIWLFVVQVLPSYAPIIAHFGGIFCCLFIAIWAFLIDNKLFNGNIGLRIFLALISILIVVVLIANLVLYYRELKFQGIILKYTAQFLNNNLTNFVWLVVFFLLIIGFFSLIVFQHASFMKIAHFDNNFFNFASPIIFGVLNIIEFLWGLQFLRDAFIFIISGNAADWYWRSPQKQQGSLKRLMKYNWGSVVFGSFMNAFMRILSNLVEIFILHPLSWCAAAGRFPESGCNWCVSFFGLIRTDSYAYINIFGNSYFDSSKKCQNMCLESHYFEGYQSPMRNFRISAGVLLVTSTVIFSYPILKYQVNQIGLWLCIDLIVASVACVSLFASLHASAAQGIQTSILVQNYKFKGYNHNQYCLPSFKQQIQALYQVQRNDRNF